MALETPLWAWWPQLSATLRVDALGYLFALLASGLWLLTSLYSVGYVRLQSEKKQTRYFSCFAICLGSTVGIAFSSDLLSFFIFYEILTIATYPLVVHRETPQALRAGRKYLLYTLSAGVCLLAGVAWTWILSQQLSFVPGGFLKGTAQDSTLRWLFLLFGLGWGVKAAIFPLQGWLPSAMVAPTPVSALLHAVAVVKAGVFGCLRVSGYVFGLDFLRELGISEVLAILAAATIVGASLAALLQDNLKRRLAYSTVSQLSYIMLGVALASEAAWRGAVLHLVNHGVMKITLFFCAGAMEVGAHREKISEMGGIGRRMPWTLAAFAVASFGMMGTPLLCGFISKWHLALGSLEAGRPIYLGVLLLSSFLNAAYFLPIVYRGFFCASPDFVKKREAPWELLAPLLVTAGLILLFGSVPPLIEAQLRLVSWTGGSG